MPKSRTAPNGTVEVYEQEVASSTRLRFNESLSWRAGGSIPIGELLRRLQSLSKELKDTDQEEADRESLIPVAKELAAANLLGHKDKGVRAWTACCTADILRLCAPEAPFTAGQLKDIFTLYVKSTIPSLADAMSPYNGQHLYTLQSLSQVKSIILLTDIPSSSSLIHYLFTTCFDILSGSGDDLSKNVEYNMTGLLECMIDECQALPVEVVHIILAQFLRADPRNTHTAPGRIRKSRFVATDDKQSTLHVRQLTPAYNMAKNLCNACTDRMARYVSQYFSNVIMDASSTLAKEPPKSRHRARASSDASDQDEDEQHGSTQEDFHELEKAHRLLRELWKAAPGVVQNVIPQVEAELSAENVQLRMLATETIGDMISGIGAAGPPSPPALDAAAYPPLSLDSSAAESFNYRDPMTPSSPQSFAQTHPSTYQGFLSRRIDKSAVIRSLWTTGIGRILTTSAGGIGLSPQEEHDFMKHLSAMLIDSDEKVRIAAIQASGSFGFKDFVFRVGALGPGSDPQSLLHNLADRVKDRKHAVRAEAILLLGKLYGVGAGEIAAGNDRVRGLLGSSPSRIFDAFYVNDRDVDCLIDRAVFDSLMPLGYPSIKHKEKVQPNGGSQHAELNRENGTRDTSEHDPDKIRTRRILVLVKDLDQRGKHVFFNQILARPIQLSSYMSAFLTRCEDYNGGVMDKNQTEIKQHLGRLVEFFAKTLPESSRAAEDLWKFAKVHDRRSYSLIRFCMASDSDYRKVYKSMKELRRRMETLPVGTATLPETLSLLVNRVSNLFYNKSHIRAIMEYSQTNEDDLGTAAHELLKEISARNPSVFKAHADELCRNLEAQAPTPSKTNSAGALDSMKACASFTHRFPDNVPKDSKFPQSMVRYALHGSPPAIAKYAVSIIFSSADKKEMYMKDLLRECVDGFTYGSNNFLVKLACLSQLMLVASKDLEDEIDPVIDIAIEQVLLQVRRPGTEEESDWQENVDEECEAKIWSLKILVNRLRSQENADSLQEIARPVYQLLNTLIEKKGELSKGVSIPKSHRSRLRLQAALLHLKLCSMKSFDGFLTAAAFNKLAFVAQDVLFPVREGFVNKVKKYLGQDRLPARFYTVVFLLAFEPTERLREDTKTWVRAQAKKLSKTKKSYMEIAFARLLSLLAHHPDFYNSAADLEDFVLYIIFYLKTVATEEKLPLIYYISQRVKAVRDAISPDMSDNLYCLSDLAQAVILHYEEMHNWSMQTYQGKIGLPPSLFAALPNHEAAQEIARKQYLPEQLLDQLESLVKGTSRSTKRKSDSDLEHPAKRRSSAVPRNGLAKHKPLTVRGTNKAGNLPKLKKAAKADTLPRSERRTSGRAAGRKSYTETAESEDDADMRRWDREPEEELEEVEEQGDAETKAKKKKNTHVKQLSPNVSDTELSELSDPPDSDEQ